MERDLLIFSPFLALAVLVSSLQLVNSAKLKSIRWGWNQQLHSRSEMPIRYFVVLLGNTLVLLVAAYLLVDAFV